ncbi:MAG: FAD-dependent oxidoreductase [Pseudomonadota bacterium]
MNREKTLKTEVLIIGAGMTGASIARELSQYKTDVIVVEKSPDTFTGQTKAGHGLVYSGRSLVMAFSLVLKSIMAPRAHLWEPDTLKLKLTEEGYRLFEPLAKRLEVPYAQTKMLFVARNEEELKGLRQLMDISSLMGIKEDVTWLDRQDVLEMSPKINRDALAGVYEEKWTKTIFPPDYAIANAENARDNGVRFLYDARVKAITPLNGGFMTQTSKGSIESSYVINAAGLYADVIADMADARDDWGLVHNRSQMLLCDKRLSGILGSVNCIHAPPRPGRFEAVSVQVDGNPYVFCGAYYPTVDKTATDTTKEWFEENLTLGRGLIPAFSKEDIITSFVGVRSFNTRDPEDHIIEFSKKQAGFLNVAIRLPGFCVSAAMAKYVVGLLGNGGVALAEKSDYKAHRRAIPRFEKLPDEDRQALIHRDSRYGRVVCRCETVTEGEIVEAIRRGARTIQGIQFRTRAGMGRCQRNFCGPRLVNILARELDIPVNKVTQKGRGSEELFAAF